MPPSASRVAAFALVALSLAVAPPARADAVAMPDLAYELQGLDQGRPRGLMLNIHGGGWRAAGAELLPAEHPTLSRYQRRGWATLNVTYHPGSRSLTDVRGFYDWARSLVGPDLPICAAGSSAGGHLALMLAAKRPGLRCVISNAGPTDLNALRGTPVLDRLRSEYVVPAFGAGNLDDLSPLTYAPRTRAEVLLLTSENDPLVPPDQGSAYALKNPRAQALTLGAGTAPWAHAGVSETARAVALRAELRLMRRAERRGRPS